MKRQLLVNANHKPPLIRMGIPSNNGSYGNEVMQSNQCQCKKLVH